MRFQLAVAAGVGAGCVAACLWRAWRLHVERQQAFERQITALAAEVRLLQEDLMALSGKYRPAEQTEPVAAADEGAGMARSGKPKAETLAVIAAAASAFLGKAARVRSVQMAPVESETVSPWSQQGRMIVQTSHNLRARD